MVKNREFDGFKWGFFESILKPLREENYSGEYYYQQNNMKTFLKSFSSLEARFAKAYAKITSIESQIELHKASLNSSAPATFNISLAQSSLRGDSDHGD